MKFGVVTIFPEMFSAITDFGVVGKAINSNILSLELVNPREFTNDRHKTVDDKVYGGGPGMVMMAEPLLHAVDALKTKLKYKARVVAMSPQGRRATQNDIKRLAKEEAVIFVAGRYEGIDERFIELAVDEELSIGDYILSGGELASMCIIDAISRCIPEVVGNMESVEQDSFGEDGLLDCPHYTRPEIVAGLSVPKVLLSGDHKAIAKWRLKQRLGRTYDRRSDLFENHKTTNIDAELLEVYKREEMRNE